MIFFFSDSRYCIVHNVSYEHFNIEFLHICSLANSDDLYKMTLGYSAMTQDLHSSHLNLYSMDYCEIFDFPLPKNQLVLTIYLFLKYNKNFGSLCTKKVSLFYYRSIQVCISIWNSSEISASRRILAPRCSVL